MDQKGKEDVVHHLTSDCMFWDTDFDDLSPAEQMVVMVYDLDVEVKNGGFAQYYSNTSGDHAANIVDALKAIGAHACADIVGRAHAVGPAELLSHDREVREDCMDHVPKKQWESLEDEYFAEPDPLFALLFEYLEKHRDEVEGLDQALAASTSEQA